MEIEEHSKNTGKDEEDEEEGDLDEEGDLQDDVHMWQGDAPNEIESIGSLTQPIDLPPPQPLAPEEDPMAIHDKLSRDAIISALNELYSRWHPGPNNRDPQQLAYANFGLTPITGIDRRAIESKYKVELSKAVRIQAELWRTNMIKDEALRLRMSKILNQVYSSRQLLLAVSSIYRNFDPSYDSALDDDLDLARYTPINTETTTPYQNLLLYILIRIKDEKLARYGQDLYEMRLNNLGQFTYSWQKKQSMKEFVHSICLKDQVFEQFTNLHSPGTTMDNVINFLTDCQEPEIPSLVKNRHVHSFRNGIYIHDRGPAGQFCPYSGPPIRPAPVAAKYFDLDFNPAWVNVADWRDIPTPNVDKLLSFQDFDKETVPLIDPNTGKPQLDDFGNEMTQKIKTNKVTDVYWALKGRMLYEIGELQEDMQIIKFSKGLANTGKSKDIHITQSFYDPEDIGTITNDIQQTFGASVVYDRHNKRCKFLWVAPDVKGDLNMEQAQWQSFVSGNDPVVITFKREDGIQLPKMPAPGHTCVPDNELVSDISIAGEMSGNEPPGYRDNAGSVSRRTVVFDYVNTVMGTTAEDPDLEKKLDREMPAIIVKANRAYREFVLKCRGKGIWSCLPDYFKGTRSDMQDSTNSLAAFLNSDIIKLGKDLYMPLKLFREQYYQYCDSMGRKHEQWNKDFYTGPFAGKQLTVSQKIRKQYPRSTGSPNDPAAKKHHGTFVLGCDLAADIY